MCNYNSTPKLLTLQVGYLFLKLTYIFLSKAFFQTSFSILQQLLFRNTFETIFLVHSILFLGLLQENWFNSDSCLKGFFLFLTEEA